MEGNQEHILEEADWLFRKMVRKLVKEREKVNIEGIMLPGFLILKKIFEDGKQRLCELAEELDLTPGAITGLCDKLEKKGLAVRERLEEDRRTVFLNITKEGIAFLEHNHPIHTYVSSVLFEGFSLEEIEQQIPIFKRFIHNLENSSTKLIELTQQHSNK